MNPFRAACRLSKKQQMAAVSRGLLVFVTTATEGEQTRDQFERLGFSIELFWLVP